MRLLKRRSAPTFARESLPSTLSLVELPGPGVASTSTQHAPPLPKSHSVLDVHLPPLPNKPTPRTPKTASRVGTELAEAHGAPSGNVLSSSLNPDGGDEDRRWTHASSGTGRTVKADAEVAAAPSSTSSSVTTAKRDSGGQNRYPPNSLIPGNGWGFGRMRKSRKQDIVTMSPPLRKDSLS